jgi:agmatinase
MAAAAPLLIHTAAMAHFDPSAPALHDGIYGLPHTREDARVVIVPVPWEATVSYGAGTADGPAAILKASRQVDLRDRETGRPYEAGIAMLPISDEVRRWSDEARAAALPVIEAGGAGENAVLQKSLADVNALGDRMNGWVHEQVASLLAEGKLVGVIGGDHSVPFGAIRAMAERHPGLGVLHFDAHADLREAYEGFTWSHASIMWNVMNRIPGVDRLVQVGIRDFGEDEEKTIEASGGRMRTWFEPDLRRQLFDGQPWNKIAGRLVADLPQDVYVSFDIDGLDPALCPHTGTPVPGGLSFAEAVAVLRVVVESGRRIVGFDLNEVAPDPEGRSEWDANVGARLLYKEIGFALLSQPKP